ncbi:MAG: OmpA family protein, partial [Gammaproteobacteria bacterium]|nr:OmpA family protein [Gammaproteobacteria bacterium]
YESEAAVQQMIIEGEPLDAGLLDVAPIYLQQQPAPTPARAANVNPEEDHPLLSRYPGATVRKRHKAEYETVKVPMSTADGRGAFATRELVGDLERHVYALKGVSTLKVHENYKAALDKAGFKTLFACALEACGSERQAQALGDAVSVENAVYNFYRKPYYVVAERVSPQGSTYVVLYVGGYEDDVFIQQTVLETTPLQSDLVQVNAESLHRDIEATGKALIYGIYFDTDKASIKPESTPTLEAIADLLNRHPQLNLYVVGHTDDSGARSHNEALSLARATAVVEQLTRTYRIGPDRLLAQGVGPYAPAASNRNDAGKAQNRRVELVQRL